MKSRLVFVCVIIMGLLSSCYAIRNSEWVTTESVVMGDIVIGRDWEKNERGIWFMREWTRIESGDSVQSGILHLIEPERILKNDKFIIATGASEVFLLIEKSPMDSAHWVSRVGNPKAFLRLARKKMFQTRL